MTIARLALALGFLAGLAGLLVYGNVMWLAAAAAFAIVVEVVLKRSVRWLEPVLLFCAVIALLEWIDHRTVTELPLKSLVGYLGVARAFQLIPWVDLLRLAQPQSRLAAPVLFLLFVRHFILILRDEAMSSLTAYRLAVPHSFRYDGVRALAYSLDSFFRRCLFRAERFYAALLLRGLAE